LLAASRATATIVCEPSETPVLFQVIEYGDVMPEEPALVPTEGKVVSVAAVLVLHEAVLPALLTTVSVYVVLLDGDTL
jgi:hypothetical protein